MIKLSDLTTGRADGLGFVLAAFKEEFHPECGSVWHVSPKGFYNHNLKYHLGYYSLDNLPPVTAGFSPEIYSKDNSVNSILVQPIAPWIKSDEVNGPLYWGVSNTVYYNLNLHEYVGYIDLEFPYERK